MNIIYGSQRHLVPDSFTVLELDTFVRDGVRETAYCVIDRVPLHELPVMEYYVRAHQDLIEAYRNRDWDYCESAINGLAGRWNGDLDSFYGDLAERVRHYREHAPDDHWNGCRSLDTNAA